MSRRCRRRLATKTPAALAHLQRDGYRCRAAGTCYRGFQAQEAQAGLIIGWESFGEHLTQVLAEAVLLSQRPADIPTAGRRTGALLFLACKKEGHTLPRNPRVPLAVSGEGHVTLGF